MNQTNPRRRNGDNDCHFCVSDAEAQIKMKNDTIADICNHEINISYSCICLNGFGLAFVSIVACTYFVLFSHLILNCSYR